MTRLSISIAMCTYNGARYARDQLDSLATQARKPDEVVICDDCSSDGTVGIIEEFIPGAPFPVWLVANKKNLGATRNYEQAIGLCHGDVIVIADQDDVSLPDRLQKIEAVFVNRPTLGAVFSDSQVVDDKLQPSGYTLWQSLRFHNSEQDRIRSGRALDVLLKYNVASGATMAFNVRLYRHLLMPIPGGCLGDYWTATICAAIGELGMIEEPLVKYRKHAGQMLGPQGDGSLLKNIAMEACRLMAKRGGYFRELRIRRAKEIDGSIRMCGHAYARLNEKGFLHDRPDVAAMFEEKLAHLEARKKMAETSRLYRLVPAIRELAGRRYRRYSNGLAYLLGDIIV